MIEVALRCSDKQGPTVFLNKPISRSLTNLVINIFVDFKTCSFVSDFTIH